MEQSHTYLLDGQIVPSVSTIIKDGKYANIPKYILEKSAEKGTAVHKATEDLDTGKEIVISNEWMPYVYQYIDFRVDMPEVEIYPEQREMMVHTEEYAGTIDIVGKLKDKILIADIKTTSKLYEDSIALQLAGYITAHAYMHGNKKEDYVGAVVWLQKDKYVFMIIEPDYKGFNLRLKNKLEEITDGYTEPVTGKNEDANTSDNEII